MLTIYANLYFLFHIVICVTFHNQLNTILFARNTTLKGHQSKLNYTKQSEDKTSPLVNLHFARYKLILTYFFLPNLNFLEVSVYSQ